MRSPSENGEEVLALLGLGYIREEIAEELDLSPTTVKRIIRGLCRRYGVNEEGLRRMALDEPPVSA